MIDEQLLKFCEEEPAAAERLAAALRSVVEFYQGRGAMLRSLAIRRSPRRSSCGWCTPMADEFWNAQQRVTSELPRVKREARDQTRRNIVEQLEASKVHLRLVQTNPTAVRITENNIMQLELRLTQLDSEDWINA